MSEVHFTNLLIVVTIALVAPLALGFFPRVRLPAIVLEIVLGIAVGPSGLGWVTPDLPVTILALIGLAFLLFLSGLEIDVERLRGRILKLTALGFALSFGIAIVVGLGLKAGGFVRSPLFVAIVLVATSLGVIVPVLKDSGNISSSFGQLVIAAASIADFGAIILLSVFFSGSGSTDTAGTLILLGLFGLVVALVGLAIAGVEHSIGLSRVLVRLQDTTAQIRVRAAFVLLIGFATLAQTVGLETILGAFAAGALLSLIDRDTAMTHPQFRIKLEAVGFGVFIPVFFVTSGLRFDLNALFASASTVARVPLFLLALLLVRGLPALTYTRLVGRSRALIAGVLQATSLPFIVAATQIGVQIGVVTRASAAGLVAAGLLSVILFPALGLVLLRREQPDTGQPREAVDSGDAGDHGGGSSALPRGRRTLGRMRRRRAACRADQRLPHRADPQLRSAGDVPPHAMKLRAQALIPVMIAALAVAGCGAAGHAGEAGTTASAAPVSQPPPRSTPEPGKKPSASARQRGQVAVRVARTAYGRALVDRRGFALYQFTHDAPSTSRCFGACAAAWPPYLTRAAPSAAAAGADARLLGSVRRPDGRLQVTYARHPLYYYVGDRHPGEVRCQAVLEYGGTWNVVAPDGHAIR